MGCICLATGQGRGQAVSVEMLKVITGGGGVTYG